MRLLSLLAISALASCTQFPRPAPPGFIPPPVQKYVFGRMVAMENGVLTQQKGSAGLAQVQVAELEKGLRVALDVKLSHIAVGKLGIHLHSVGRCDGPDFVSAGPHWNPAGHQHGKDNPMGSHAGDLRNIEVLVGAHSSGELFEIPGYKLSDLMDSDGAAIVIHEKADDYKTDPSGNSGKRIACGVLEWP